MAANLIKLANCEGRTFALGQTVVCRGESEVPKVEGTIIFPPPAHSALAHPCRTWHSCADDGTWTSPSLELARLP